MIGLLSLISTCFFCVDNISIYYGSFLFSIDCFFFFCIMAVWLWFWIKWVMSSFLMYILQLICLLGLLFNRNRVRLPYHEIQLPDKLEFLSDYNICHFHQDLSFRCQKRFVFRRTLLPGRFVPVSFYQSFNKLLC